MNSKCMFIACFEIRGGHFIEATRTESLPDVPAVGDVFGGLCPPRDGAPVPLRVVDVSWQDFRDAFRIIVYHPHFKEFASVEDGMEFLGPGWD